MNELNGFILLDRKMLKWEWYQDTNMVRLFIHLLLMANWEDKKWQGVVIKRGQFITSLSKLSQQTDLTIQQVRTCLERLILTNEITKEANNKYTLITIKNYDKYQDLNKYLNKRITNEQQTNNKRITTTENNKNNKNNKNNNNINNNIYDFVEQNFGRTLSPVEYEEINTWNDTELTRYAIKQSVILNKCSIRYVSRILSAYERENVKTVQQAQERERQYNEAQKNKNNQRYKTANERKQEVYERFLASGGE